ncbi:MAG: VapC toxin family PIN domain ribonuclease [Halochromatium sp.]|nr:VapC toxin family PIN domain ribonuclease [Halochromatium sp.]
MGQLRLPDAGLVYLDANCLIYSVEHIEPYDLLLQQVWHRGGVMTSELSLLEVLVKPFKAKDRLLQASYRELLKAPEVKRLMPLTAEVLEQAARLRAEVNIKTPDAIHAASALIGQATLFLSNDERFKRVPGLPFQYLNAVAI